MEILQQCATQPLTCISAVAFITILFMVFGKLKG